MTSREAESPVPERVLFGLLLLLHAATYLWLIFDRRMVPGHDTLYGYVGQYLFLAHSTQSSEPMLWLPYAAHGLISNFTLQMQGGMFQNALLALGGAPEGANMLPLFHLCFFFDDLVLLLGMWCLGRRLFPSPYTRFFVAAAAIGSGMWLTQMYWNHRLFYVVPLVLSLIHDFLDQGKRWKLLLALNLLLAQFMGQFFYGPPMTVLAVMVYFGVYAAVFRAEAREWRSRLRPRAADVLVVGFSAVLLAANVVSVVEGTRELRQYRWGRNPDGSVTLDAFLTFAGGLNPVRYADLFLGITPSNDYSLYCGVCVGICALLAFFLRPGKRVFFLAICILLVVLFSAGFLSLIGAVAFGVFPPLHYFRYVSLTSPFAKVLVILLAGYGLESLLRHPAGRDRAASGLPTFVLMLGLGVALMIVSWMGGEGFDVARNLRTGMPALGSRDVAGGPAFPTVLAAVIAASLVLFRLRRPETRIPVLSLLLLVHAADLYRWKIQLFGEETRRLDDRQYALQRIEPVPYIPRRGGAYDSSPRYQALKTAILDRGTTYEISDAYLHFEPSRSQFWTTHWLEGYDLLLRARARQPLLDRSVRAAEADVAGSPSDPYRKIAGVGEDKLQVFASAHPFASEQELADWMNQRGFRGDRLGVLRSPGTPSVPGPFPPPGSDDRLPARISVLHFDANRIRARVELPAGKIDGWLLYADVWHPSWEASVNGRPAAVERAFLAYKAVRIDSADSVVEFRFRSPYRIWSYRLLCLNSLFWVGFVLVRLALLFLGGRKS